MNEADIKQAVIRRVYKLADEVDWLHLSDVERQRHYENWTSDPQIGGLLIRIMDVGKVRVYLKDTVIKSYYQKQRPSIWQVLRMMGIPCEEVSREYRKPSGVLCSSRDLFTITAAKDWKIAIMSAFERGGDVKNLRRNVVYVTEHTSGRFVDKSYRDFINRAAERLDVQVYWVT